MPAVRALRRAAVALTALTLAACTPGGLGTASSTVAPSAATPVPSAATPVPSAATPVPPPSTTAGRTSRPAGPKPMPAPPTRPTAPRPLVVLDPGHDGGNAARPEVVTRQVDAGNGRTKPCNTVGTSTVAGYPEHAFAWDVAVRTRALLAARGVKVVLTRQNDIGVGPCVDVRGRFGNALRAAAVVSVHADGAAASGSGFHVIQPVRAPGGAAVAAATRRLALAMRAALRSGSGLDYADYTAGGDGLDARDDLAGLNLSRRPTVVVESGNMRNPADAAMLSSPTGRQRIAAALAAGVLGYLHGR